MTHQESPPRRGNTVLWAMLVLAMAYGGLLYFLRTLSGDDTLDGVFGVLLGLYICSHPAANAIDVLFFGRRRAVSAWSEMGWLGLNLLVLLAGWIVIVLGAIRLTGRGV